MADEIDRAQAREAFLRDLALTAQRLRLLTPAEGPERCVECGAPIPEARRQAVPGCTRCVGCQADVEGATGRSPVP